MTIVEQQTVRCLCCGTASSQEILASTNRMGSPDLDQRPPEMMRSTMYSWLQECPSCGYVAKDLRNGDAADREFVRSDDYRELRAQSHVSDLSCRFLLGAALARHRSDMERTFLHTLSAAWAADDLELFDEARALRRQAAGCIVPSASSPDLRLRLLDVLRRAWEWEAANFLAAEMSAESLDHSLASIVRFQSEKISARDDTCYTIDEVPSVAYTGGDPDDALLERIGSFITILPPKPNGR